MVGVAVDLFAVVSVVVGVIVVVVLTLVVTGFAVSAVVLIV